MLSAQVAHVIVMNYEKNSFPHTDITRNLKKYIFLFLWLRSKTLSKYAKILFYLYLLDVKQG